MTNQEILDAIEFSLPSAVRGVLKDHILDAIWDVLIDHNPEDPEEDTNEAEEE